MLLMLRYYLAPFLLLAVLGASAAERLVYPLHQRGESPEIYPIELLRLALARSGGDYRLEPTPEPMTPIRARHSLAHNDGRVQVIWTMTTRENEERLQPVRIPIYKGLIGWRICLLRGDNPERLAHVYGREDLQSFSIGQRQGWPDTSILRANGFEVRTSNSYTGLFGMLAAGRFDLFPRETVLVRQEQRNMAREGLQLAIDPYLVLHYPSAFYYFTARQRPELAETIRRGLEAALADGSAERLFQQHFGEALASLQLDRRRVIELDNPLLPPLPLEREELWYRPRAPQ